jgi:glycosyltransferase involved in cell wall biosynthesis
MADAAERLLTNDALRAAMAERAVALVDARFTLDRQVEAYLALYRELLAQRATVN